MTISSAATTNDSLSGGVFAPHSGISVANINVGELATALNTANVIVATQNTTTPGAGVGDITVSAPLTWTASTTLSLNAVHDVKVNQAITGTGGSLVLTAGNDIAIGAAISTTTGNLDFTAAQDVNLNAATTITTGNLNAIAGRNINVSAASTITGGNMLLRADNDGTGPGVSGGTVNISCGNQCITLTNGTLSIRFNPASVSSLPAEMAAYEANLTGAAHALDAKAWVFAQGVDKLYDATTVATLTLAGAPAGAHLVPGTANFASKDAAANISIAFSGYTTSGAGTDLLLWSPIGVAPGTGTTSANITAVPLTITAVNFQKSANGVAFSGGNGVTYSAFAGGETQANLAGSLTYGGSSQGAVSAGSYLIVPSGRTSQNYTINYVSGALNIDGATLIITPANVNKNYGQTASLTDFTVVGLLNGDTLTSVIQNSTGAVATASVAGGPYAIVASGATGSFVPGVYTITYVNGTLTVIPVPLTITANNAAKVFGQMATLPATAFTSQGLVNGDMVSSVQEASTGIAATAGVAGAPYPIAPSGAAGSFVPSNYSISYVNGRLTVTPAPLTITANDANKTYGQTAILPSTAFTASGLVNGDTVSQVVSTSTGGVASAPVSGNPYPIKPSAATGNFVATNYAITYANGSLTVTPPPVVPDPVVEVPVVVPDPVVDVPPVAPPAPEVVVPPVIPAPVVPVPVVPVPVVPAPVVDVPPVIPAPVVPAPVVVVPPVTPPAPEVVVPPVVPAPVVDVPPVIPAPVVIVPPVVTEKAVALPNFIPARRAVDRRKLPLLEKPVNVTIAPSVLGEPAELVSLTTSNRVIDAPIIPLAPVMPVTIPMPIVPIVVSVSPAPAINPEISAKVIAKDVPSLATEPVLVRPRKQDRN